MAFRYGNQSSYHNLSIDIATIVILVECMGFIVYLYMLHIGLKKDVSELKTAYDKKYVAK